jgi:hypothetical protein
MMPSYMTQISSTMPIVITTFATASTCFTAGIVQPFSMWNTLDSPQLLPKRIVDERGAENLKKLITSLETISDIQCLEDDWNGYKALEIPTKVIQTAQKIVWVLAYQPEIYPTGRASIQMQYELADHSYLEFEIYTDNITVLEVPQRDYDHAREFVLPAAQYRQLAPLVGQFFSMQGKLHDV